MLSFTLPSVIDLEHLPLSSSPGFRQVIIILTFFMSNFYHGDFLLQKSETYATQFINLPQLKSFLTEH